MPKYKALRTFASDRLYHTGDLVSLTEREAERANRNKPTVVKIKEAKPVAKETKEKKFTSTTKAAD